MRPSRPSYSPALSIGAWGWALIVGAVVLSAAVVYFSGGTAGPFVATIGTWIGNAAGLSGAAATSYGLALLGGGSLASGGLGMIGGAAVLTAALTFGTEVTIGYGLSAAESRYDASRFAEESKSMLTLPPPRVAKGSAAYEMACGRLEGLSLESPLSDAHNQEVLGAALRIAEGRLGGQLGKDDACQLQALRALLHFQRNEYADAKSAANDAIELARELERRRTLPAFIFAVSSLADEHPDMATVLPNYLRYSFLAEPDNRLIPAMCGIFLDRAMYRYNSGAWTVGHLGQFMDILCEPAIGRETPVCLAILATRTLIQIKREQQSICANTGTMSETLRMDPGAVDFLNARLASYTDLVGFMRRRMLGELANRAADLPRDSGVDPAEVRELVAKYEQALPDLRASIGEFAKAQQQARQQEERARYRPAVLGMIAAVAGGGFLLVWRRRAGRTV